MSNTPTPAQIRAQQHLTGNPVEDQSLGMGGDAPTGKSRIYKPYDSLVTQEVMRILNQHAPEQSGYKVEIDGNHITGPTEAFKSAIEEIKGQSRNK